jgi:peptide methionine sulfoxide reductase MsrA
MEDIELYAIEKARLKKSREDIEFFLAFLIKLAPIFNLPITTTDANHIIIANLKASDINQAKQIIEEKVTAEFEGRLAVWPPWNQHQRFLEIKNKKYTDLPLTANTESQQYECSISSKIDFNDAVIYANKLYSYQELIRWYVQQGTDPFTNIPIDLSKIYRIEAQNKYI